MDVILSTRNTRKMEEIRNVLHGLPITILSLDDAKIEGQALETGRTLVVNAMRKAEFAWMPTRKWSIADDSGLFTFGRHGWPGVETATWAGEGLVAVELQDRFLQEIDGWSPEDRKAVFKTEAVAISPLGKFKMFSGKVPGSILTKPRGRMLPMMPYSAIFVPDGQTMTFAEIAEISIEEENAVSHRGIAFRKVRKFFEGFPELQ